MPDVVLSWEKEESKREKRVQERERGSSSHRDRIPVYVNILQFHCCHDY